MNRVLLKNLAGAGYTSSQIDAAATVVCAYICAYCGTETVPPALSDTAAVMAKALLEAWTADEGAGVSAVKVGDTAVTFADTGNDTARTVFAPYQRLLNRYRKVCF